MRRTGPGILLVAAVLGIGAGFLVDQILTSAGRPTFTPTASLPIVLVLLGALVLVFAVPIRRAARDGAPAVNPFRAVRIAMLAKASSIVGAAVGGLALGLLLFLLTRPVPPSIGSMGTILATAAAGAVLIAAGLIAEWLCTIRKDDDDIEHGGGDAGPGAPAG